IPVAANHAPDVVDGDEFPGFVADGLPAGNLFDDEQADFVASVAEVARLGVVRREDEVCLGLLLEEVSVAELRAEWHGLANEREGLVTGETDQLDDFAVESEAVLGEFGVTEAGGALVGVDDLSALEEADVDGVEVGMLEVPELDAAQRVEVNGVDGGLVGGFGWWKFGSGFGGGEIAFAEFGFERQPCLVAVGGVDRGH